MQMWFGGVHSPDAVACCELDQDCFAGVNKAAPESGQASESTQVRSAVFDMQMCY